MAERDERDRGVYGHYIIRYGVNERRPGRVDVHADLRRVARDDCRQDREHRGTVGDLRVGDAVILAFWVFRVIHAIGCADVLRHYDRDRVGSGDLRGVYGVYEKVNGVICEYLLNRF